MDPQLTPAQASGTAPPGHADWRQYVPFGVLISLIAIITSTTANDFFQFWYAGRLIVTGRSPYDPDSWADALSYGDIVGSVGQNCIAPESPACLWVYPPWTAWFLAPFGAFDPSIGVTLEQIAFLAALALGVASTVRQARLRSRVVQGVALAAFAISAPFVRDAVTGHFEGVLLAGVVLLMIGLTQERSLPIIFGCLLIAMKPHLMVVLACFVLIALIRKRAFRLVAALVALLGTLVVAGIAADPLALPALTARSATKVELVGSTTWAFAAEAGGRFAPLLLIGLVAASAAAVLVAVRGSSPERRYAVLVASGAAGSLVLAPYAQSYDHVLLFPAIALALAGHRVPTALVILASWTLITWGAYGLSLVGEGRTLAGLLPTAALVMLAGSERTVQRRLVYSDFRG